MLLFAGNEQDLEGADRPAGLGDMRAVKTGRVHAVSRVELLIPGPRTIDGIEHLAAIFHPATRQRNEGLARPRRGAGRCPSLIAACAGHDWATPADLLRAIAGDQPSAQPPAGRMAPAARARGGLVGALLGLGGTVFQGVFRNPLAEPYLLGSAGGAALGATVALLVPLAAAAVVRAAAARLRRRLGRHDAGDRHLARVAGAVDAAGCCWPASRWRRSWARCARS